MCPLLNQRFDNLLVIVYHHLIAIRLCTHFTVVRKISVITNVFIQQSQNSKNPGTSKSIDNNMGIVCQILIHKATIFWASHSCCRSIDKVVIIIVKQLRYLLCVPFGKLAADERLYHLIERIYPRVEVPQ